MKLRLLSFSFRVVKKKNICFVLVRKKTNLKEIQKVSICSINRSTSDFLIFSDNLSNEELPADDKTKSGPGQGQVQANLGGVPTEFHRPAHPIPSLCPLWFLCVPAGVGGPRPCPAVQGHDVCCRPHIPGQHLKPGIVHVQNLALSSPGQAISFLQAQLSNPR